MPEEFTRIFVASSIGNTHIAKETANQDSVESWIAPDGVHFCVAISDGHGSSTHPYSEFGSKFAVAISIEVYKEAFDNNPISLDPLDLFQEIISRWSAQCNSHFTQQISAVDPLKVFSLKLYGATLCIVYVSGDSISIASLGDSTVYFRNHNGRYSKFLIHDDSPGEATFSLCQSNAISRLEITHIPYSSGIIVFSTDGIIKSLKSSEDYSLIVNYYLGLLKTGCTAKQLSSDLSSQLETFSRDGSGDDCTLAIVYIPVDKKLFNSVSNLSEGTVASLEILAPQSNSGFKKKVSNRVFILLPLMSLLLITALLTIVTSYKPIKNQVLLRIRSSLCSKDLNPGQLQNPVLQVKGP